VGRIPDAGLTAISTRNVRIGLYGPMANAGYTLTRGIHAAGIDAEYIHEPADRYPMSQPMWEDVAMTFDPARLPHDLPTSAEWLEIGRAQGWRAPEWVVEMDPAPGSRPDLRELARLARLAWGAPRSARTLRYHRRTSASRIATFRSYDWLVVCGVGVMDAFLAGVRYAYWPNGGDLTIVPFRDDTPYDRFVARTMRAAISGATVRGTHDPILAEHFDAFGGRAPGFLPFLVDTDRYAHRPSESWGDLARELRERAAGRPTLLVAARQSVRWKGTDRFARAFTRALRSGDELFLVLTPWGDDTKLVRHLLNEVPPESVWELPGIASKPLLVELYSAADVVVDQFTLGVHGSTMLEALACGTPVMISLDVDRFRRRWPTWVPPPVINVASEEDILRALHSIARGETDVEARGREGREWVERMHGVAHATSFLPDSR
jgi:glycosyltransferase involved in cell wall biosynthesis